jgi:Fe-S-cluster containining protein
MEFTLDLALLRDILRQERTSAALELRAVGPLRALERSQPRHDARIAAAADVGTLACTAGCSWCCHFTVDVRAAEVFHILDVVERSFSAEQKIRIGEEIRANSRMLRDLGDEARATLNVKCPFLVEGQCSIYAARPQTCRNYHATDAAGCQRSYEEPENLDIDPDFAPGVFQAGAAHVDAFSTAMRDAGYDANVYELNGALAAALADPGARRRFNLGSQPFIDLAGEPVPLEFDDLED